MRSTALAVTVLSIAATSPSRADEPWVVTVPPSSLDTPDDHASGAAPHYDMALLWAMIELAIPGAYYWNTQSKQAVDWTLRWDWASWKEKLTLHALSFDTNSFTGNTIRHPFTGLLDYQIARSNGFGVLGSYLFAVGTSVAWEYLVEYPEAPSLNDLLMTPSGGIAIGEPLYQIGQLWRGGNVQLGDRLRTAAFSPVDAFQDVWRRPHLMRPRAWSSFAFTAGTEVRSVDTGASRAEAVVSADIDLVTHPDYLRRGERSGATATGAWSRIATNFRFGNPGDDKGESGVWFHSRTSLAGYYGQDDQGNGAFLGVGTAFTYRRDRLDAEWDKVAFAHLLGPQLQLVSRSASRATRWDFAAYTDFSMIQAHVFGPRSPLPPPGPYASSVQVAGYYDGFGVSAFGRVRTEAGPWWADAEASGHRVWQINAFDRLTQDGGVMTDPMLVPHHIADWRAYAHGTFGYRIGRWGLGASAAAVARRGTWEELARTTYESRLGVIATLDF